MFDLVLAVFNGVHTNGALLQFLECDQFNFDNTQFGGYSKGSFHVRYGLEESGVLGSQYTTNINAPNRVQSFLRLDQVTSNIGPTNEIPVTNSARFHAGQNVLVWNGAQYDNVIVSRTTASTIVLSSYTANSYNVGTSILALRYTGFITAVNRDATVENFTTIETSGYQSQLSQRLANIVGGGKECGWVLQNLLNLYASEWDLSVSSDFVASSDGSITSGTGQAYFGTQTDASVASTIKDILTYANANTSNLTYTVWVDEFNQIHFNTINSTTPTASVSVLGPASVSSDGIFNELTSYQLRDEDLQNLCNVVKVTGGSDSSGNAVTAIVEDQDSIKEYGQWECTISQTGLTTEAACAAYGQSYLNVNSFPRQSSTSVLDVTGSFLTAQDYVQITGFKDGSTVLTNIQTVTTTWNAGQGAFSQQIQGQENFPGIAKLISEIANQKFIAATAVVDQGTNIHDRYVISGLDASYSGGTFSMTAGSLGCLVEGLGLKIFSLPSYSFAPQRDGIYTVGYLYRDLQGGYFNQPSINVSGPSGSAWSVSTGLIPVTSGASYQCGFQFNASTDTQQNGALYIIDGTNGYGEQYAAIGFNANTQGATNYSVPFTPQSSSIQVVFQANGGSFNTGAVSFGDITIQTGSTSTPLLVTGTNAFTNVTTGGYQVTVDTAPEIVAFPGTTVPSALGYKNAQIVPLYYVQRLGGVITAFTDKRQYGSVNIANLSISTYTAPTFNGSPTVSPAVEVAGLATAITVTATVNNVPQDYGCSEVCWFYRPTGTAVWTPVAETNLTPFPLPSPIQTVSFRYGGLTNGQSYDFGLSYLAFGGNYNSSQIGLLASNVSANAVGIAGTYLLGGTPLTPTVTNVSFSDFGVLGGLQQAINVTFKATNEPQDGSFSGVTIWQRSNPNNQWVPVLDQPANGVGAQANPPASYTYGFDLYGFSTGTTYYFGVSYQGLNSAQSAVTSLGAHTTPAVSIPTPYLLAGSSPTPNVTNATLSSYQTVNGVTGNVHTTFTITNQPIDGSLSRITIYYRMSPTVQWVPYGGFQATGVGSFSPPTSATYSVDLTDMTNGASYYLGVSFENTQGGESGVAPIGSITVAVLGIASQYLLGGTGITPAVQSGVTVTTLPSVNNVSAAATVNFTLTNQPTDGSLSRIGIWAKAAGAAASTYQYYGSIPAYGVNSTPPPANGSYSYTFADLVGSKSYDFGASYESASGAESNISDIYDNYASVTIQIGAPSLATIPNSTKTAGPSFNTASYDAPTTLNANGSAGAAEVGLHASFNDWANGSAPAWFSHLQIYYRISGTSNAISGISAYIAPANTDYSVQGGLGAGQTYDFGCAYVDQAGNTSNIVWPSGWYSCAIPGVGASVIAGSTNINLIPDSNLDYAPYNSTTLIATSASYWKFNLIDGSSFGLLQGSNQQNNFFVRPADSNKNCYGYSQTINVIAGSQMTISAYIDASKCGTSGGNQPYVAVQAPGMTANYAVVRQTAGVASRVYQSFTVPSGVTQVIVTMGSGNVTINSGILVFSIPQLEYGSVMTAYKPGTIATSTGTVVHSTSSPEVQSVISVTATPGQGSLNVSPTGGVAGNLPYANHATAITNTIGSDSSLDVSQARSGKILPVANHASSIVLSSLGQQANLVPDGDFQFGSSYWTASGAGVSIQANTGAAGTGVLGAALFQTSGSSAAVVTAQPISVGQSLTYTFSLFYTDQTSGTYSGNAAVYVYDQSGASLAGFGLPNGTSARQSFQFTTGSSSTTINIYFQNNGSTWSGGGVRVIQQVQVEVGSTLTNFKRGTLSSGSSNTLPYAAHSAVLKTVIGSTGALSVNPSGGVSGNLPYANHASAITSVISTGGAVNLSPTGGTTGNVPWANSDTALQGTFTRTSSTQLTTNASTLNLGQASIIPASTSFTANATPSSSSTAYTTISGSSVYSTIFVGWSAWSINYPNGTTASLPSYSGSNIYATSFNSTGSGLQPSTSYYLNFYYLYGTNGSVATGVMSTSSMSQADAATMFQDGHITLLVNSGPVTTPAKPASGSTGGTTYTPPPPTCPGENQELTTLKGRKLAKYLVIGDFLKDWDGGWNEVTWVAPRLGKLYRLSIGGESFEVDSNHLFWCGFKYGGWFPVHSMRRGDIVATRDGRELSVDSIEYLGVGNYIEIQCTNQRFMMGRTLNHNIATRGGS